MSDCNAPDNLPNFLEVLTNPFKMWLGKDDSKLEYTFEDAKRDAFPLLNVNENFQKAVESVCGQDAESLLKSMRSDSSLRSTFNNGVNAVLYRSNPIKTWYTTILRSNPIGKNVPYRFSPALVWPFIVDKISGVTGAFEGACANIANINNENLGCKSSCVIGALPARVCEDGADTPGVGNPPKWNTSLACSEKTTIATDKDPTALRLQWASKYHVAARLINCDASPIHIGNEVWGGVEIFNDADFFAHSVDDMTLAEERVNPGIVLSFLLEESSTQCQGKYRIIIQQNLGDDLSIFVQPGGPADDTYPRYELEEEGRKLSVVLDKTIGWSSYQEGVKKTQDLAQEVFGTMLKAYGEILTNAVKVNEIAIENLNKFLQNLKTGFKDLTENPEFAKAVTLQWLEQMGSFAAAGALQSCPPNIPYLTSLCANEALYYIWNTDQKTHPNSYWAITATEAKCILELLQTLQILSPEELPEGQSKIVVGNIYDFLPEGCVLTEAKTIKCGDADEIPLTAFIYDPILGRAIRDEAMNKVKTQTPEGDESKGQFTGPQCATAIPIENGFELSIDDTGNIGGIVRYKFSPVKMWRQVAGVGEECNAENIHKLMQSLANALTATIPPGCDLSVFHNLVMGQTASLISEEFIGSPGKANPGELKKIKHYCSYTFPNRQNNAETGEDGKKQILPDDCADYPQIFPQEKRYSLLITIWIVTWALNRKLNILRNNAGRGKQIWMKYYESKRFLGSELFE